LPPRAPAAIATPIRKPSPDIRVNLTATPVSLLRIGVRGPYEIHAADSGRILAKGDRLNETPLRCESDRWLLGERKLPAAALEVVAKKQDLIAVGDHAYHGRVTLRRNPSGKLTAINVLPLESYVSCVIDAEMPAKFPAAAREAQAIIARTYALWQMQQADRVANYDVFATVRSQKYLGAEYRDRKGRRLAGESAESRRAAAATQGKVCQVNGRIFCTYYSAVCGGATTPGKAFFADADAALASVPCEWCRDADKYRWKTELPASQVLAVLRQEPGGRALQQIRSIRQLAGPQAGVVSRWEFSDGRTTTTVDGIALRQKLPAGKLLSPHCALRLSGETILAEGSGFGHGAGLCQWGARGLALAGKSAEEIVQHYYPGCAVATAK
jgi:stage II sporulation protein D